jgi:hypothetical protein
MTTKDFKRLEQKVDAIGEALRAISCDQQLLHNSCNTHPYSAAVLETVFGNWKNPKEQ